MLITAIEAVRTVSKVLAHASIVGTESESVSWQGLPLPIRAAVERKLGSSVVRVLRQPPECEGGIALRLLLTDNRWVFIKGVPAYHPAVSGYRAEIAVARELPSVSPIPTLMSTVDGDWLLLIFSDVNGAQPKLRPGSPDLSSVLAALGALAKVLTPCPIPRAPEVLDDLAPLLRGWRELHAAPPADLDPWSSRHLDSLVTLETSWHPWAAGDTLLHNDLHPGNLVLAGPGRVRVINWRYPARGAAWLDLVSLVPHLLVAGNAPTDVERLLRRRPVLSGIPAWAVTAFGVALAGHAERTSRLPEPIEHRGLRRRQAQQASVMRQWIAHRTRWE